MSKILDINIFNNDNNTYEFKDVLERVQIHISTQHSKLLNVEQNKNYLNNTEKDIYNSNKKQLKAYIEKYIQDNNIKVLGLDKVNLVEKLYKYMAEFAFISDYLPTENDKDWNIEEININAWDDIKISYSNGEILPSEEKFLSPKHAEDIVNRMLRESNMILDKSEPIVRGHLSKNIRITVLGTGVIDEENGVVASIRIVNPKKLSKQDFVNGNTLSEQMINTIEILFRYGVSMCITGATNSGKTTFMSWLLGTISNDKRLFTIENNVREFDLIKRDEHGKIINNVVHTVTRYSEDESKSIDQERLLETALTSNPDYICVGEMKGSESFAAQEGARTGHTVITTTHANSCDATYSRMVTLCKLKYDINDKTLYNLVTEAFPLVVFIKRLEDKTRKVMEIKECIIHDNGERELQTLFRYNIESQFIQNGKTKIVGSFEKVNNISIQMQKRLRENGIPLSELDKLLN